MVITVIIPHAALSCEIPRENGSRYYVERIFFYFLQEKIRRAAHVEEKMRCLSENPACFLEHRQPAFRRRLA
jgi:hypothetical protein